MNRAHVTQRQRVCIAHSQPLLTNIAALQEWLAGVRESMQLWIDNHFYHDDVLTDLTITQRTASPKRSDSVKLARRPRGSTTRTAMQ